MKKVVMIVLIIAVAAGGLFTWRQQKREEAAGITVSGTIENAEVSVGSTEGGRVAEVFVKEGDVLREGDPIVRLSNTQLESALGEADAAVKVAEAALELLRSGYPKEDIEAAQAAVNTRVDQYKIVEEGPRDEQVAAARADADAAAAQYENARRTYQRMKSLFESGVVSMQTVENAQAAAKLAEERKNAAESMYDMARRGSRPNEKKAAAGAVNEGRARLKKLRNGARPEELKQAEAAVAQARARLATIQARVRDLTVRAPSDCTVDVFDLYAGDLVAPGGEVSKLELGKDIWIDVYMPSDKLAEARLGARVKLAIDAFPGEVFDGKVSRVARTAEFTPRNVQTPEGRAAQVFRTRIMISDPKGVLQAGMTASVMFGRKSGAGARR